MNTYTKKQVGDTGENYCVKYMKRHGYKILHRQYRKRCGEIDVVAKKGDTISFAEVKTRSAPMLIQPCEAVNYRKQRRLIQTAQWYIAEFDVQCFCRFDVCEVIVDRETLRLLDIRYIENAFYVR